MNRKALADMDFPELAREFLNFKGALEHSRPVRIQEDGTEIYEMTGDLREGWMEMCQEVADRLNGIEGKS